jgi:hypothetical protein
MLQGLKLKRNTVPPVNGYALTKAGFESDEWKAAYEK